MRFMRVEAFIVAVILGLACFHANLFAQEENEGQEGQSQAQQKADKKTAESEAERAATKAEPISNSLSSYRVEFTLTEFDSGKKINSRTYSLTTQVGPRNKLRIGGRVPVSTSTGSNMPSSMQFQYLDIGMRIDCSLQEQDGSVVLDSTLDSSSAAPQVEPQTHQPVIRQMRYEARTVLTPGKPAVIGSMDDPTSKSRFQIDVTATKVR